jgi:hypothetical protein
VVVRIAAWVVQGRGSAGVDSLDDPELLEELERRVHGGKGGVGERAAHMTQDLLGGHVAIELAQRAMDQKALRSDALAASVELGAERLVCCLGNCH